MISEKTIRLAELPANTIDFVLVTAVDVERDAVKAHLRPLVGQTAILKLPWQESTYYLGECGHYACALVMCDMRAGGRGGSTLSIDAAIARFKPRGVIMVGVAFGNETLVIPPTNKKKQRLGDVVVATQLIFYEVERRGTTQNTPRGPRPESGQVFRNRLRNLEWKRPDEPKRGPIFGPVLSGDKLVDNDDFKNELFRAYPDAVAGEMEGEGLYAASAKASLEWILIKGICDWANGLKHKRAQPLAAKNAADLVRALLSDTGLEAEHFSVATHASAPGADAELRLEFELDKNRIRELSRMVKDKADAFAGFMMKFMKGSKPEIPKEHAAQVDLLRKANATAIEELLNAYNDLCAKFLATGVPRQLFFDTFANEVKQLVSQQNPYKSFFYPREKSPFTALWAVYDQLVARERTLDIAMAVADELAAKANISDATRIKDDLSKRLTAMLGTATLAAADPAGLATGLLGALLVGVATPIIASSVEKYRLRRLTVEAAMNVRKLYDSAVSYYLAQHADKDGNTLPPHFPPSIEWTPAESACTYPDHVYPVRPEIWDTPTWLALNFSVLDVSRYSYRFERLPDGFVVEARGDLDCNGVFSSFRRVGRIGKDGMIECDGLQTERELD